MKVFLCGDVIPGCPATFTGLDDGEIFRQVVAHVAADHGIASPPPELRGLVLAATRVGAPSQEQKLVRVPGDGRRQQSHRATRPGSVARKRVGRRLRSAFDDAPIGMAVTTPTGAFVEVNRALCDLLGRTALDLLSCSIDDVLTADDAAAARAARQQMLERRIPRHQTESHLMHSDGHVLLVLLTCSLVFDHVTATPAHIVCHLQDITARQTEQEALAHQALHDSLTGLPNRVLFLDRLEHALQRRERRPMSIAVLFCDLDRFKWINDSFGHAAGDAVLVEFACRLRTVKRRGDTAARLYGDEFVVLCEEPGKFPAAHVAERIRHTFNSPFIVGGEEVFLTASVGAAIADDSDRTPADVLRRADQAMYAAKQRRTR